MVNCVRFPAARRALDTILSFTSPLWRKLLLSSHWNRSASTAIAARPSGHFWNGIRRTPARCDRAGSHDRPASFHHLSGLFSDFLGLGLPVCAVLILQLGNVEDDPRRMFREVVPGGVFRA